MTEEILTPPIVRCAYKELVAVDELVPHTMNPNKHPPKQIEMFIAILQYSGVRRPITVSTRSGMITKGHGQLEAYKAAGWKQVPVDYQDYEDEASELADLVADNQLAKLSEMQTGKLQEIGVTLDTGAFNMQLLGMEEKKLEQLMTVAPSAPVLAGADGAPVVGAGDEAPAGMEGSVQSEVPASSAHVRMVQLFFTEDTQAEFMMIVEHFQKTTGIDNVTDTVLEILRAAYRAQEGVQDEPISDGGEPTES